MTTFEHVLQFMDAHPVLTIILGILLFFMVESATDNLAYAVRLWVRRQENKTS